MTIDTPIAGSRRGTCWIVGIFSAGMLFLLKLFPLMHHTNSNIARMVGQVVGGYICHV